MQHMQLLMHLVGNATMHIRRSALVSSHALIAQTLDKCWLGLSSPKVCILMLSTVLLYTLWAETKNPSRDTTPLSKAITHSCPLF